MLTRLIAPVAAAAAVLAGCASPPPAPPAAGATALADNVPVQLQFTAKTLDGVDFRGRSLRGRPAVLWFWAPWCPVCQGEAPAVGGIAAANPSVSFVGVAGLDQVPAMRAFVAKHPVNGFTELADTDGAVWARFGVTRQPAYAFVRADGDVAVVGGPLTAADLTQRVAALSGS